MPSVIRSLAPVLAVVLMTGTACTKESGDATTPPDGIPAADKSVRELTAALVKGDVSTLQTTPAKSPAAAQAELATVMGGMDGLHPSVVPGQITYHHKDQTATVPLDHSLPLGGLAWTWQTTAQLKYEFGAWKVDWKPQLVHPDLTEQTRLRHDRVIPARAAITGADGQALVETTVAYRVGVDKANLSSAQQPTVATALAKLVKIDPAQYVKQVKAAGARAFVPAITLREGKVPAAATTMKGVLAQPVEMPLGPSSSFAVGLLGTSGQATTEQVAAGKGDVLAGDYVGQSGLQKRYDARLRGTIGHRIELVQRTTPSASPSPSDSTQPAEQPDESASPSGSPGLGVVKELFASPAKPGTPVALSLDRNLQTRAEEALASQKGIASLAVVKVGSGDLLAAANSTASGASPNATFGHFPPGSTFKVVSSLALLRKGLTPTSTVPCTKTVNVNGRNFENYDDFPAGKVGNVTLTDALANSCNTAFLSQHAKLTDADLAAAAASLGVGVDHEAGFPSFFGSVPPAKDPVTKAANLIGQGQVEASPMAMAGVAASVASGKTVVPWLVADKKPAPKPTLSPTEAQQLQTMMKAVVSSGSGAALKGVATGAKTGTAEFGASKPPKTHAWMIAWNDKYAVAALVNEGKSGSKDAAPILKSFLAGG
ncbi:MULTISPECIES: penicillin-binding transpeptidase domain-containing protein [unclassified Luteococcus]|uniref:penicillin-binding transpeptidase domain-containing protein n=1 Tax=unclassified Luteococcus TaxID=2639923 RepID=UPI00313E7FD9